MTADPTPHVPHVVTVMESTVYAAVCATCPWTVGGFVEEEWATFAARQHEKGHSVAVETKEEGA